MTTIYIVSSKHYGDFDMPYIKIIKAFTERSQAEEYMLFVSR